VNSDNSVTEAFGPTERIKKMSRLQQRERGCPKN